jgi:hypothetical protein
MDDVAQDRKRPRDQDDVEASVDDDSSNSIVDVLLEQLRSAVAACTASRGFWLVDLRRTPDLCVGSWRQLWSGVHDVFLLSPHQLVAVELEGTILADRGAAAMARAICEFRETFSFVSCWFLASTQLSASSLHALIDAWSSLGPSYGPRVKILGLTNNPMIGRDPEIFAALSSALPLLERLHLNHVGLTTAAWQRWLPELALHSNCLKHLWLKQNPGLSPDEVKRTFVQAENGLPCTHLARVVVL